MSLAASLLGFREPAQPGLARALTGFEAAHTTLTSAQTLAGKGKIPLSAVLPTAQGQMMVKGPTTPSGAQADVSGGDLLNLGLTGASLATKIPGVTGALEKGAQAVIPGVTGATTATTLLPSGLELGSVPGFVGESVVAGSSSILPGLGLLTSPFTIAELTGTPVISKLLGIGSSAKKKAQKKAAQALAVLADRHHDTAISLMKTFDQNKLSTSPNTTALAQWLSATVPIDGVLISLNLPFEQKLPLAKSFGEKVLTAYDRLTQLDPQRAAQLPPKFMNLLLWSAQATGLIPTDMVRFASQIRPGISLKDLAVNLQALADIEAKERELQEFEMSKTASA